MATKRKRVKALEVVDPVRVPHVWYRMPLSGLVRFDFAGFGAFPYPCVSADQYPDAPVYQSADAWTFPGMCDWGNRVKELDGKATAE